MCPFCSSSLTSVSVTSPGYWLFSSSAILMSQSLDHVWIWQHGAPYFGVPLSNFFGWFLTAYVYYLAFALYSGGPTDVCGAVEAKFLVHGDCALCYLRPRKPLDPQTTDGSASSYRCRRKTVAYSRYFRWLHAYVTSAHDTSRLACVAQAKRIANPALQAL
jgi:Carotenoid biosynthesis protein